MTFKKADAIREAAAIVPLGRLLVETDCPFMAPEPFRGRSNEPAFVVVHGRRGSPRSRGEVRRRVRAATLRERAAARSTGGA